MANTFCRSEMKRTIIVNSIACSASRCIWSEIASHSHAHTFLFIYTIISFAIFPGPVDVFELSLAGDFCVYAG